MASEKMNFVGTLKTYFEIGKATIVRLVNNSGVLEIRDTAGTAYLKLRALRIQSSNSIDDVPTLLDTMDKVIQFSFDGASAPAAGTNTGKYGFCHTTGGSHTAAQVVYDDGASLILIPVNSCKTIFTTDAVSGTVSLNADGVYGWEGSAYVLKGDGAATDTGLVKCISVAGTHASGAVNSTASIPVGATVTKVVAIVTEAFDGTTPTLLVQVNGDNDTTIMATTENDLKTVAHYHKDELFPIASTYNGVVTVTFTPDSSSTGEATIYVFYTSPSA
jgi:hypothetical protein